MATRGSTQRSKCIWKRWVGAACLGLLLTGCSTPALNRARSDYYAGRLDEAENRLENVRIPRRQEVLFLMERGTVRQSAGNFDTSSRDFITASARLEALETYSLSQGAGSLIINDAVKEFVGAPFERTLLQALTAQNHLSIGHWDHAAIEARRIAHGLSDDERRNYPDVPYAHYIAGLAFEFIDDPSNAALQYRRADEALPHLQVDPDTGRIQVATPPATNEGEELHGAWPVISEADATSVPPGWNGELVVIWQSGRSPSSTAYHSGVSNHEAPLYADIYVRGVRVGRTYNLADTAYLRAETARVTALRDAAKTISRIAVKEGIAMAAEHNTEPWVGDLIRILLIGFLEHPDDRQWETLPRWFQVGRVAVPADFDGYTLVLKNQTGQTVQTDEINSPLQRRRNRWISFHRSIGL